MVRLGELTPPQPSDPEEPGGPGLAPATSSLNSRELEQVFLVQQTQALLDDVARELPTGALSAAKRAALVDVLEYLAGMLRRDFRVVDGELDA